MQFKTLAIISALAATALSAPISTTDFDADSIAVNVIGLSASAEYGMWVPTDGNWYSTSSISCLNVGASSWTACNNPVLNQIGVVSGYTCAFAGASGWQGSQVGTSSSGFLQIGPPQRITAVACVSN